MRVVFSLLLGLTFFATAMAEEKKCVPQKAYEEMAAGGQDMSATTICCCRTYQGGQCCAEVTICGTYIPGCYCAPNTLPSEKTDS